MVRLLNKYEELTYERLLEVASGYGAHVFPKVRIADILPVNNSGISSASFGFSLKAHFDFTVTDDDYNPLFVVEFDGPLHHAQRQLHRDSQKNNLCDFFGLSLLRINANYLDVKYRDLDLLTYFVDVWFLHSSFTEAQEGGDVPYDEPFDPTFILSDGRKKKKWPYWLSVDLQNAIRRLQKIGKIRDSFPSHWIGVDKEGNYRCVAWLHITNDDVVTAETGMRQQRFPVDISDLLSQLSVFDIHEKMEQIQLGTIASSLSHDLENLLSRYKSEFEFRGFAGLSHYQ